MSSRRPGGGPSRREAADPLSWLAWLVVPQSHAASELRRDGRLAALLYLVSGVYGLAVGSQLQEHRVLNAALPAAVVVLAGVIWVVPWQRLPAAALNAPVALGLGVLSVAYGCLLGELSHFGPIYALALGYTGLVLGAGWSVRWGVAGLAGLGVGVLGNQREHLVELVATIAISAFVGELVSAAIAVQRRHGENVRELHEGLAALLAAEKQSQAAGLISRLAADLLAADGVTVLVREHVGSPVLLGQGGCGRGSDFERIRLDSDTERTAAGTVAASGSALFVPDVLSSPLTSRRWADALGAASVLYLPIIGRREVLAVIAIWWSTPVRSLDAFPEQIIRLLSVQAAPVLERLRRLEDLDRAAYTDPLTGIGNRRAFEHALDELAPDAAVVVCDLDRFKALNDSLGHAAGDRVLRDFAATLQACVRRGDLVARIGGDEFALLLKGGQVSIDAVLPRLGERWHSPEDVGFSAGGAVRLPGESPEALCERADQALYDAKRAGRRAHLPGATARPSSRA